MSIKVNYSKFMPEQMQFILALADPDDNRTQAEIAASMGYRPETLSRWKKLPDFSEAIWESTYSNLEAESGRIAAVLMRQARSGDHRAIKTYFELLGRIGAQRKQIICNRDHVLSAQEFGEALRQEMTESQVQVFVEMCEERLGVNFNEFTRPEVAVDEQIKARDFAHLETVPA